MKFRLDAMGTERFGDIARLVGALLLVVAVAVTALVFSGQQKHVTNAGAGSGSTSKSSANPTPKVKPTFAPSGTASDNIAYFRFIVDEAITAGGLNASTEALAKQLAASGFDAKGIQYSDNSTAVGMKPDSVTVSTLFKGQCLIAQYGPSISGLTISVLPELKTGGCLIGRSLNHL